MRDSFGRFVKGFKHSEESRRKISASLIGNTRSVGRSMSIPEGIREKIRMKLMGHPVSEESRRKMRKSHLGKRNTKSQNELISKALVGNKRAKGIRHTDEWKAEQSKRSKGNKYRLGKRPTFATARFSDKHGHLIRSTWEDRLFGFLILNGVVYKYEPEKFEVFPGGIKKNYWPDARIEGTNIYLECKGWFDKESIEKMSEFRKSYPRFRLFCVAGRRSVLNYECFDEVFMIEDLEDGRLLDRLKKEQRGVA